MSDQPQPTPPVDPHLDGPVEEPNELLDIFRELCEGERRRQLPAEFARFSLPDSATGAFELLDDIGAPCLSYAIYNPSEAGVLVAFGGGPARAGFGAFPVSPQTLCVIPVAVGGHIALATEEEEAVFWRARFATPQPFFVGRLK